MSSHSQRITSGRTIKMDRSALWARRDWSVDGNMVEDYGGCAREGHGDLS
jgi:hypothetical protein